MDIKQRNYNEKICEYYYVGTTMSSGGRHYSADRSNQKAGRAIQSEATRVAEFART